MNQFLKHIISLVITTLPLYLFAQNTYNFSGVVEHIETKDQIGLVAIQLLELNRWTTSDLNGEFNFDDIPEGIYTIQASCLGYERYEKPVEIKRNIASYNISMEVSSLGLNEITVVARENTSLSSSSTIENVAIEHSQPTSLSDIMQLAPGQISLNPDLSKANQITIRDINTYSGEDRTRPANSNDALGTAIIIDGTPMDNDANMQSVNTTTQGQSNAYSTAGGGIDIRQISTDFIESVEVIRGIPSVQYGDLTTGVVLIKTKSGKTPLKGKVKTDPKIKQVAISKGFLLEGENKGAVNIEFDYTHSYDDLREPASIYKRINGQFGYSNTLFKKHNPLSINFKGNYFRTLDDEKKDPDQRKLERQRERESGLDLKIYGKWSLQKWWLGNLSYNLSGSFKQQNFYNYTLNTTSATPIPTSYLAGEYAVNILPSSYYSELNVDGKPYNYFATIKLDSRWKIGKMSHKVLYGFDWRVSGNNGEGRLYDLTRPPRNAIETRPRAFKDIPASKKLALFAEDRINLPIGTNNLEAQIGIRYNNFLPKGIFSTNGFNALEPRINVAYKITDNDTKRILRNLTLRGGFGKTSKTPTMLHMYPDAAYIDKLSFNYSPELIVSTTEVIEDTSNPSLKPMSNKKYELGADFNIKGIKFIVTGFSERIRNGYSWEYQYFSINYRKWDDLGKGFLPVFDNGEITYEENGDIRILPYGQENEFERYKSPINNYSVDKKGIEYVINFGRINPIKTELMVDGAYYHIKRSRHAVPFLERITSSYQGDYYPYLSVLPGNSGIITQRLNSNIQTITHIPKLKMIFSLNLQTIWMNKFENFWENESGTPAAYTRGEKNEKLYGQFSAGEIIYVDPVGFYDMDMDYHKWQDKYSYEAPTQLW
ncbi:TonB-dependent receptor [Draconibacterium halophilum]|uniref:TonB-dependent receptor n=1 Tax=Draconibacterium halophilum TaxID=2706887 RepID=A0A6C0RDY0_9BACT|nr:TonB-dependent receptor [Draconibacterium halophilum]QIA07955.1 TonB-dependent receptor [Draconibacterium halophilum]